MVIWPDNGKGGIEAAQSIKAPLKEVNNQKHQEQDQDQNYSQDDRQQEQDKQGNKQEQGHVGSKVKFFNQGGGIFDCQRGGILNYH